MTSGLFASQSPIAAISGSKDHEVVNLGCFGTSFYRNERDMTFARDLHLCTKPDAMRKNHALHIDLSRRRVECFRARSQRASPVREGANRSRSYPQGPVGEATAGPSPTRPPFTETLAAAVAAYPEARVELDEKGVVLHASRPPSQGWPPVPFWQADRTPHPPRCFRTQLGTSGRRDARGRPQRSRRAPPRQRFTRQLCCRASVPARFL